MALVKGMVVKAAGRPKPGVVISAERNAAPGVDIRVYDVHFPDSGEVVTIESAKLTPAA
jgi:hypothetical protein